MDEINIILQSDIGIDNNEEFKQNDKNILFEKLNNDLHIINLDKKVYNNDIINVKLLEYIYNDDFIDFLNDMDMSSNYNYDENINFENIILKKVNENKESTFSKKIVIKKILEFIQPIIGEDSLINPITVDNTNFGKIPFKKNVLIDKNQITLNYPIFSKYFKKNDKKNHNYIIPSLNKFKIKGLYNDKHINMNIPYKYNKFNLELNYLFKINNLKNIFIKYLKYNNKALFDLESVKLQDLISLYKNLLNIFSFSY